jgi:hypothetical protein
MSDNAPTRFLSRKDGKELFARLPAAGARDGGREGDICPFNDWARIATQFFERRAIEPPISNAMNVMTLAKTVIREKKYPSTEPNIAAAPRTTHHTLGARRTVVQKFHSLTL